MTPSQSLLPTIAIVGPVPPPAGGMANQTRQLAELLASEGMQVEVVPVNPPYYPSWVGKMQGIRAVARMAGYIPRLWRAASRYDVFHVMANSGWSWDLFAVPAILIARLRGKPVIVNYRGGEAPNFLKRSHRRVCRVLKYANALAVPSGFLHETFSQYGVEAEIVPNIVNVGRFYADEQRSRIGNGPHIVISRNLESIYGIDIALKAFAELVQRYPAARLSIAGSGPLLPNLQAQAEQLGVSGQVRFLGRLAPDEVASLYRSADIMLNASRVDNMPNSVLEAWACGIPIVTTNVGGVPYMARDGETALFVPPDDSHAMANALIQMTENAAVWESLRTNGLHEAQRYTWANVKVLWLELYRRLSANRSTH